MLKQTGNFISEEKMDYIETKGVEKPARMRTIDESYKILKAYDTDTMFTKSALRKLCVSGQIKTVKIGRKYLINLDNLFAFLYDSTNQETIIPLQSSSGIRKIEEKIYK